MAAGRAVEVTRIKAARNRSSTIVLFLPEPVDGRLWPVTDASLAAAVLEIGMADVAVEAVLADAREFKSPWIDVTKRANVVSNFDRHYHECWQHLDRAAAAVKKAGRSTDAFDETRRTL